MTTAPKMAISASEDIATSVPADEARVRADEAKTMNFIDHRKIAGGAEHDANGGGDPDRRHGEDDLGSQHAPSEKERDQTEFEKPDEPPKAASPNAQHKRTEQKHADQKHERGRGRLRAAFGATVITPPLSLQAIDAWRAQLLADRMLPASASKVGVCIAQHVNRRSGEAWPSIPTIVDETALCRRSVINMLSKLEARGYISVGRATGMSNRYRLAQLVHPDALVQKKAPVQKTHATSAPGCTGPVQKTTPTSASGCTRTSDKPLNEPQREESHSPSLTLGNPDDHDVTNSFSEFWKQYPLKKGKEHARKAYERIIKDGKATAAELLAGALRYAAERDAEISAGRSEARFTKFPKTWLNGGCWTDEPTLPPSRQRQGTAVGAESASAGIWRNIERKRGC